MKWAVILAGGHGRRLQPLTRALTGDDRPKQFCPLLDGETPLTQTRRRLLRNVDSARSVCVVIRDHAPYYRRELSDMKPAHLIEQPANLGTAAAIAYGIARIGREDKKAVVGVYPADHHYEDDETLRRVIDQTYCAAEQWPDLVFLLGTEPDCPEVEYGWIEPASPIGPPGGQAFAVRRFWEKPSPELARTLLTRGCLWNMFVMIGSLGAFRRLLHVAVPLMARAFELVEQFPMARADTAECVYRSLAPVDFSHEVLEQHLDNLAVVRVPQIGWTDLGQPARVYRLLSAHGSKVAALGAIN